jgi:hypothetical protein
MRKPPLQCVTQQLTSSSHPGGHDFTITKDRVLQNTLARERGNNWENEPHVQFEDCSAGFRVLRIT